MDEVATAVIGLEIDELEPSYQEARKQSDWPEWEKAINEVFTLSHLSPKKSSTTPSNLNSAQKCDQNDVQHYQI